MKSILEQLYIGNIQPAEHYYSRNKSRKKLLDVFLKKQTIFRSMLSPELLKLCDDVADANLAVISEDQKTSFIDGFRLGGLTMLEVLLGNDGFQPGE